MEAEEDKDKVDQENATPEALPEDTPQIVELVRVKLPVLLDMLDGISETARDVAEQGVKLYADVVDGDTLCIYAEAVP